MSGMIDPSGLPRWFLLILAAVGITAAMSGGYLNPGYNVFGSFIRTMDVAGGMFVFGAIIALIAYLKWV